MSEMGTMNFWCYGRVALVDDNRAPVMLTVPVSLKHTRNLSLRASILAESHFHSIKVALVITYKPHPQSTQHRKFIYPVNIPDIVRHTRCQLGVVV